MLIIGSNTHMLRCQQPQSLDAAGMCSNKSRKYNTVIAIHSTLITGIQRSSQRGKVSSLHLQRVLH